MRLKFVETFALLAERGTGRYVGSAFITLNREMRERLWKRVQDHAAGRKCPSPWPQASPLRSPTPPTLPARPGARLVASR